MAFDADVLVLPESFRPDSGTGMLEGLASAGYRVETRTVKLGDSPVSVKLTKAPQYYAPVNRDH